MYVVAAKRESGSEWKGRQNGENRISNYNGTKIGKPKPNWQAMGQWHAESASEDPIRCQQPNLLRLERNNTSEN